MLCVCHCHTNVHVRPFVIIAAAEKPVLPNAEAPPCRTHRSVTSASGHKQKRATDRPTPTIRRIRSSGRAGRPLQRPRLSPRPGAPRQRDLLLRSAAEATSPPAGSPTPTSLVPPTSPHSTGRPLFRTRAARQ
jgi:hypothetical protein